MSTISQTVQCDACGCERTLTLEQDHTLDYVDVVNPKQAMWWGDYPEADEHW